jgi:hypothetical protein
VKPTTPKLILPPTALSRDFVRKTVGFGVGVGLGMAPFLGAINIPGFKALYSVLPFQIRDGLIALSAFVMGLIAIAIQFSAAEKLSRPVIRKRFSLGFVAMLIGFIAFVALRSEFTESVERGKSHVSVMIGSSRIKGCGCPPSYSDAECIETLGFRKAAIASCWGSRTLRRLGLLFTLSYLSLTGGFAALVGLLMLQQEAKRQAGRKDAKRPAGRRATVRRKAAPPPASAPPPPPASGDAA